MAIIKNVTGRFVAIDKDVLEDTRLSYGAKGVYCVICANNNEVEIDIYKADDMLRSYLAELYFAGYITKEDNYE